MSNSIEFDFYTKLLKEGEVSLSSISNSIKRTNHFKSLNSGSQNSVLLVEKSGRGSKIKVNQTKINILKDFYKRTFPNPTEIINRVDSVGMYRDSKKQKRTTEPIYFLRGNQGIEINNSQIDLKKHTDNFGLFAAKSPLLKVDKLCFVENKDVFLEAEKLIGSDFIFIHKYGRVGTEELKRIEANEVLVFSDYDYTGLNEYLNIKSIFKSSKFFMPENYDYLFENYSKELPEIKNISDKVAKSKDDVVLKIKEQIQKTNRFLEQESLFIKIR